MDDHDLIARSARDVLEREFARDALHALVDGTEAEAQKLWDLAVRMGWPGVAVQEELGSLGLDARAAVALLKEYGRAAAPGALFSATVAALWSSSGAADAGSLKDVAAPTRPRTHKLTASIDVRLSSSSDA
jgi:alkylation response protein AidB-like acyl-CoA dehydrogenase